MDILSHTFSGIAVGTVGMQFVSGWKKKLAVVLIGGFGGFLPDIDAISYWSRFDETIGAFFNLKESGAVIYHKKYWYSHHALMHSLTMGLILSGLLYFILKKLLAQPKRLSFVAVSTFFFGFLAHLLEDMPTPDFAWKGVAFLYPSAEYWGGKGYIWWWNNYDLFLIILSVSGLNLVFTLTDCLLRKNVKRISFGVLLVGVILYVFQMLNRPTSFQYSGFQQHHNIWQINEAKSKEIQKDILGDYIYGKMEWFDNQLSIYF